MRRRTQFFPDMDYEILKWFTNCMLADTPKYLFNTDMEADLLLSAKAAEAAGINPGHFMTGLSVGILIADHYGSKNIIDHFREEKERDEHSNPEPDGQQPEERPEAQERAAEDIGDTGTGRGGPETAL